MHVKYEEEIKGNKGRIKAGGLVTEGVSEMKEYFDRRNML